MSRLISTLARRVALATTAFVLVPVASNADVVLDWNRLALTVASPVGPPQARHLAMVHVAMHDAINSITGEYQPYGPGIEALPEASAEAAGVVAAHRILTAVLPAGNAAYDAGLASARDTSAGKSPHATVHDPSRWIGSVAWNDNHVGWENTYVMARQRAGRDRRAGMEPRRDGRPRGGRQRPRHAAQRWLYDSGDL